MSETQQGQGGAEGGRRLYGPCLGVLALDQLTKWLIVTQYGVGETRPILGPVMSFTRRTNTGGAFSVFTGHTWLLTAMALVALVLILRLGPRLVGDCRLALLGLGMIAGGAAGNLADRLRLGHVVDFIDFHFWPVFNVADTGIVIGVLLLLWLTLAGERKGVAGAGQA